MLLSAAEVQPAPPRRQLWHLQLTDDVFAPRRFADLLATLLRDGPPDAPFDVGV